MGKAGPCLGRAGRASGVENQLPSKQFLWKKKKKRGHFRDLPCVSWEAPAVRMEWPGLTHQALGVLKTPRLRKPPPGEQQPAQALRTLLPGRALSSPGCTPSWWSCSASPSQQFLAVLEQQGGKLCVGGGGKCGNEQGHWRGLQLRWVGRKEGQMQGRRAWPGQC